MSVLVEYIRILFYGTISWYIVSFHFVIHPYINTKIYFFFENCA